MFNSENSEDIPDNCLSNFCEFRLISEGVASGPTVYSELESVAKLIFSFVPRSLPLYVKKGTIVESECDTMR